MNNLPRIAFFFFFSLISITGWTQQLRVQSTGARNDVRFSIDTLPAYDPNDGDPKRRFQAFWITGDGNYLQFDGANDAASINPGPYYYSTPGTYEATAYLTGKYTNRKPPARAVNTVNVGSITTPPPGKQFRSRLGGTTTPAVDIFSNHAVRKNYLTTFVVSWPGNLNASGVYLFYNGFKNSGTRALQGLASRALKYSNSEIPNYFLTGNRMDTSRIREYGISALGAAGTVNGLTYSGAFQAAMSGRFRDFVYYPREIAGIADMPGGFTENRVFPVLWADTVFAPQDTFLSFLAVITDTVPISSNPDDPLYQQLRGQFNNYNLDLDPGSPFAVTVQSPAGGKPTNHYIVAMAEYELEYLTTFDPNQLTVEDVQKVGEDQYEVKFRLEMCNKGKAPVLNEFVTLSFPSDFTNFTPDGFAPKDNDMRSNTWKFRVEMTIAGVPETPPGGHPESECGSIFFKARTNCNGIRSLWKGSTAASLRSCVVFEGSLSTEPECHGVTPVDSTQFLINGKCECCLAGAGAGDAGFGWPLWLLILLIVFLAIWWVYKQNNP